MKIKKSVLAGIIITGFLTLGFVGQAAACGNCWGYDSSLTNEEQTKADKIRKPFVEELTNFETKLRKVSRDLGQAVANDDASKAADLRVQLEDLERAYDATRSDMRDELEEAGIAGYNRTNGWTCQWHEDHAWRGNGRRYARNGGSGYWGCRW